MQLIYICSPFQGDIKSNVQAARRYSGSRCLRNACRSHASSVSAVYGEETKQTRELALHMGMILLTKCHELWYFGDRVSEGMKLEQNKARVRGTPVRHFNTNCEEVKI